MEGAGGEREENDKYSQYLNTFYQDKCILSVMLRNRKANKYLT
jgi:hypothetical protein